ncbi:MAG: ribosome biogenesis GTPase Der [Candidatus Hydrogenedentes bacterium]|nr:ribosome biogenesis GTPase Der [Candidatus Hydrogenedentota bacterium]
MPSKKKLPLVAIVGRPNVGKSTLFNRIVGKQRAIVHDLEGITRDRFIHEAEWQGRHFRLVDTGGIIESPTDSISQKMQYQVQAALQEARVVIFVVDGQQPLTRIDEEVRDMLFKTSKPVVLAVNKLDNERLQENRYDFFSLGLGDPISISSGHGLGVDDLLDRVIEHLPAPAPAQEEAPEEEEDPWIKVAIVGKPNVGKSSFVNAILNEERVIVDETPGTTRDSIDIELHWRGKQYMLIDTAGLRRKAGIKQHVEHFSVARTLRSVRRADVCLIMVDAVDGLSEQDLRILGYCQEQGTAMVIVWTKWDLVEDKERRYKELAEIIDFKMPQVKYVPYLTISNLTRQRLFTTFDYIDRVAEQANKRIGTGELNRWLEDLRMNHQAPRRKGKEAKIRYMTQASVKPTTFVLFVNSKDLFHFSFMRFLENRLRESFSFEGVPIQLELRQGKPKE